MSDATKTIVAQPITITVKVAVSAVLVPEERGGYSICVPALPGCLSEADTVEQAASEIVDAIEGWLEAGHEANVSEAIRAMTEPLDSERAPR